MSIDYEIFCVNLKRSVGRKKKMDRQFSKFGKKPVYIEAVDGRDLNKENIKRDNTESNALGCSMSHIKVYETIVEKKIPLALICEDDIVFNINDKKLQKYINHIPDDFNLCYLYYCNTYKKVNKYVGEFINYSLSTACYMVTYDACLTILKYIYPVRMTSDDVLTALKSANIIKSYCLIPRIVNVDYTHFFSGLRKNKLLPYILRSFRIRIILYLCYLGIFYRIIPDFIHKKQRNRYNIYKEKVQKSLFEK